MKRNRNALKEDNPEIFSYSDDVDYLTMPIQESYLGDPSSTTSQSAPKRLSKAQKAQKREELMRKGRNEALVVPIGPENKGFHLLSKFGYSTGKGLGKEEQGISDPISVPSQTSSVTVGIGVERLEKEKFEAKVKEMSDNSAKREQLTVSFKDNMSKQHELSRAINELKQNRKVIYNLDQRKDIGPNEFWEETDIHEHIGDGDSDIAAVESFLMY